MTQKMPTKQYADFQQAYDHFNGKLFGGQLPQVQITLQRHAKSRGHFSPKRFNERGGVGTVHELNLNPDAFVDRDDKSILSTLAHEMVHVWQQELGKAPRKAYHDKQWATKMKEIGLHPTHNGQPGGKEVGQNMTHYIVDKGMYDVACDQLLATGLKLTWESQEYGKVAKSKAASKTAYTCPVCSARAWAKPNTSLLCGNCTLSRNKLVRMEP